MCIRDSPYAVAPPLAGVLWLFLFNPSGGVLTELLHHFGYTWNLSLIHICRLLPSCSMYRIRISSIRPGRSMPAAQTLLQAWQFTQFWTCLLYTSRCV